MYKIDGDGLLLVAGQIQPAAALRRDSGTGRITCHTVDMR